MPYGLCLGDHALEDLIRLANVDLFPQLWQEYQECGHLKKCGSFREAQDVVRILNIMLRYTPQYRGGKFDIFWAANSGRKDGDWSDDRELHL